MCSLASNSDLLCLLQNGNLFLQIRYEEVCNYIVINVKIVKAFHTLRKGLDFTCKTKE